MHTIVRAAARALFLPAAVAALWLAAPDRARAQDNTGCSNANGLSVSFVAGDSPALVSAPGGFVAGQVITVTFNLSAAPGPGVIFNITPPDGSAFLALPLGAGTTTFTITVASAITGNVQVNTPAQPANMSGTITISCLIAGGSSAISPAQQNAMNAQVAITNGKLVLQQSNDAIKLGVLASFAAGTTPQTARAGADAQARIARLTREEADLAEELAELPATTDEDRRRDLERRLSLARSNLALARDERRPGGPASGRNVAAAGRPGDDRDRKPADGPRSMRITAATLADACASDCAPPDPSTTRWNGWFDGRLVGINDSVAQQSVFGFIGIGGVDYKLQPWLTVGFSVGTEAFTNKLGLPGSSVSQNGVSAVPYVGVRLDPNVFLSGFVGASRLNYNTVPQPGQTGQFEAWRFMAGGSLTGLWRFGPWRVQPSIDLDYGSENQAGFVDSLGQSVPSQLVQYGRLRGGPEIGYRFDVPDRSWSVEPFVLARANIDFASSNSVQITGLPTALRGQGSGGAGVGVVILGNGFNVRADVSYDSIGVTGLDIWTGRLRGGWSF